MEYKSLFYFENTTHLNMNTILQGNPENFFSGKTPNSRKW